MRRPMPLHTIFVPYTRGVQVNEPPTQGTRVSEMLPDESLKSNILICGPTLSKKDTIAFDLLAENWTADRRPFVITAADKADPFRSRFDTFSPQDDAAENLFVIDCAQGGTDNGATEEPTCMSGNPADLTGVAICLSKGYKQFGSPSGRIILLDNLSTFLVYSDIDRVYRFISTINNRVTEFGDITVHLLDTDAIDSVDKNKLLRLFPTVIQVRENDGKTQFRVRGDTETTWTEYPSRGESR